jgi:hypothetical protein
VEEGEGGTVENALDGYKASIICMARPHGTMALSSSFATMSKAAESKGRDGT